MSGRTTLHRLDMQQLLNANKLVVYEDRSSKVTFDASAPLGRDERSIAATILQLY
jgi:hypothetical protein